MVGNAETVEFEDGVCRVSIAFNSRHYGEIGTAERLASNPGQPEATNFGSSESLAERFPREGNFFVRFIPGAGRRTSALVSSFGTSEACRGSRRLCSTPHPSLPGGLL